MTAGEFKIGDFMDLGLSNKKVAFKPLVLFWAGSMVILSLALSSISEAQGRVGSDENVQKASAQEQRMESKEGHQVLSEEDKSLLNPADEKGARGSSIVGRAVRVLAGLIGMGDHPDAEVSSKIEVSSSGEPDSVAKTTNYYFATPGALLGIKMANRKKSQSASIDTSKTPSVR
jgi:hypothetical protein